MPLQSSFPTPPTGVATAITARGTTQATATPLPIRAGHVEVSTVPSGSGITLPAIRIPSTLLIRNVGANTLKVYPSAGGTIDGGAANAALSLAAGSSVLLWASSGTNWYSFSTAGGGGGSGTVTTVSVVSANGLAGTVANATTTPAITLTTSITGVLKGNGTAISAAVAGTDYLAGNQTITLSGAVAGSGTTAITTVLASVANLSLLANISGGSAAPSANTLTAVIDAAIGSTRGSVLYKGAAAWSALTPGTAGFVLTSGGAGADPTYAAVSLPAMANLSVVSNISGGSAQPSANTLTAVIDAAIGSTRGSVLYKGATGWAILAPGTAGFALTSGGTGADPVYAALALPAIADDRIIANVSGGSAAPIANTITAVIDNTIGATRGGVLYRGAAAWSLLAPGTSGTFLKSNGAGADPSYAASGAATAGGSDTQVQYNSSNVLAGAANITVGSSGEFVLGSMAAPASPANGSEWYDSTQLCRVWRRSGMNAATGGMVYSQVAVKVNNLQGAVSLIDVTGAYGSVVLPAGFLNVVGRRLRVKGAGYLTTAAASPLSIGFMIYFGTTCIAPTGNLAMSTSKTKGPFSFDADIVCKAAGGAGVGKLDITGAITGMPNNNGNSPFTANPTGSFQNSAAGSTTSQDAATQVTIDLTAGYTLDFKGNFSAVDATNTIGLTSFVLEVWG